MDEVDVVIMERIGLSNIPRFEVPAGYAILPYRPGDEVHWVAIHEDADRYTEASEELFASEFGSDVQELAKRQFYLHHGAEVIGTASAWYDSAYKDGSYGRIHWVAIRTAYQGRGLAKPLLFAVCLRLAKLGHEKAYLTTMRVRSIAIHLYEEFGFRIV